MVSSETPSWRAASVTVELLNRRKGPGSSALVLGLRGSSHAPRGVVVGWPAPYRHRNRLGRSATKTGTSNLCRHYRSRVFPCAMIPVAHRGSSGRAIILNA